MAAANQVARVNQILRGHGMAGQGKWLVYYANHYGVDLGLMVGIAGAETTWGDAGTGVRGQYNPFGFMHNGPGTGYTLGSYREAIQRMAKLLRSSYYQWAKPGKANPQAMMMKYVGYFSHDWVTTASKYANTFAGGKAGKLPKGGGSYYVNPYAKSGYLGADQGTDWDIKGPIGAIGKAKIVRSEVFSFKQGTGWIVSYRLLEGPKKGKVIYVAENIRPARGLRVGQIVQKGQTIAVARGVYPYIETGWADKQGHFLAPYGSTNMGEDFKNFLDKAGSYRGPAPETPTGQPPGMPAPPKEDKGFNEMYTPHFGQDFAMTGVLGSPGQDPITDPGREPAGIARMWQGIASLPNASAETMLFANRARTARGY